MEAMAQTGVQLLAVAEEALAVVRRELVVQVSVLSLIGNGNKTNKRS